MAKKSRQILRHNARQLALQGLYAWGMAAGNLTQLEQDLLLTAEDELDVAYFQRLLHGVPEVCTELTAVLKPHVARGFEHVTPVELAILRLGAYELLHADVPYKVAINEGIELAKAFGAEDSHKFINSVLDAVAKQQQANDA